jgi:single-strand DNA-binding protein
MNTAILCGNLGEDPELRALDGGEFVLKIRLATTSVYKNREGEKKESTQWHTIVVWGPRAEALAKILRKGSKILVRGEIQYRSWDKTDGTGKGYATEIRADEIDLCDRKPAGEGASRPAGASGQRKPAQGKARSAPAQKGGDWEETEDNLPDTY